MHICEWKRCVCATDDIEDFRYHIESHIYYRPYKCKWGKCRRKFAKLAHIRDHMRRHTNDRAFACRVENCEHTSYTKSNRNGHEKTHKNRIYQCDHPFCSAMFPRIDYLYSHTMKHKQFNPLVPCNFPMCRRQFITEKERDDHVNEHTSQTRKLTPMCPSL